MGRRSAYRTLALRAMGRGKAAIGYRRKARGDQGKEKGTVARRCSRFFLHKNGGSTRDLMARVAK